MKEQNLFDIARRIDTDRSKYEFIASKVGLPNYKIITDGEVNIRGKDLDIPIPIRQFINMNKEVIIIANMIKGRVMGILLRSTKEKSFMLYGMKKGALYGIGTLSPDFKYGDTIMIVESAIDCDVAKILITKNCLAILTATISESKAKVLSCLTNNVLLFLDNDEAGHNGEIVSKRKLEKFGVNVSIIPKINRIKDLGDLLDMYRLKEGYAKLITEDIKSSVKFRGGKVL